ncbi:MAG: hypothetical protein HY791_26155 [Deltaproteobacteria bacterium]|nr:hypothetical protein [Deltaproteobacteria bacterium]
MLAAVFLLCVAQTASPRDQPEDLLKGAREAYEGLEYDAVLPLTRRLLTSPQATGAQRLEALQLEGSSLAILGNSVDAEKPFRQLLRERPAFDLPPGTSPKIIGVFRKVQVEERAIAEQMKEIERQKTLKTLAISGELPEIEEGGVPITFELMLKDPKGVVRDMRVRYRREGGRSWSAIALERHSDGRWTGTIPPELTSSESGFVLEHYVTSADENGQTLVELASADFPRKLEVLAGEMTDPTPFYERAAFWTAVGVGSAALAVSIAFLAGRSSDLPDTDIGAVPLR